MTLEYKELPEVVKFEYSEKEYFGLGDEQRRTLIDDLCLPDEEDYDPACE